MLRENIIGAEINLAVVITMIDANQHDYDRKACLHLPTKTDKYMTTHVHTSISIICLKRLC